jgi:hypothetical protein
MRGVEKVRDSQGDPPLGSISVMVLLLAICLQKNEESAGRPSRCWHNTA